MVQLAIPRRVPDVVTRCDVTEYCGITVFARGSDGAIWYWDYSGGSWGNWVSIGGHPLYRTSGLLMGQVVSTSLRATDGAMWHKTYTGTAWSKNWESLGGFSRRHPLRRHRVLV